MTPHEAIQLFAKTLGNLEKWMDKAEAYAKDRGFEVDVLAQARLAPDQYSFIKQVQAQRPTLALAPLARSTQTTQTTTKIGPAIDPPTEEGGRIEITEDP